MVFWQPLPTPSAMNEFDRIRRFLAPLAAKAEGAFGLEDDAAEVIPPAGYRFVITQDTLVETVHFLGSEPPAAIAQKALRVNISDLVAKGAQPWGYFLSISLPARCGDDWLEQFASGLAQDQQNYGITLMGGDSTAHPSHAGITITALGTVENGQSVLRRKGATEGDCIYVTGTIGDALAGLLILQGKLQASGEAGDALVRRYTHPEPRLDFMPVLKRYATASMDVSDGLLQDLGHLLRLSGVGAVVQLENIPLSDAVKGLQHEVTPDTITTFSAGGDDYELLFTVPSHHYDRLMQAANDAGIRLSAIGKITADKGVRLEYNGRIVASPAKLGYLHAC